MKKYIFKLAVLALGMFAATSCSPDFEGTEPGNDSKPFATLYKFSPSPADGDYDPDTDVRLRIAGNGATEQVFYKSMKKETREGMSEEQVINDVVSSGANVSKPGEGAEVFLTGMQGDNVICAVAVNGNTKVLTETTFFGLTWTTVATGSLRTRFADGSTTAYGYIDNVVMQHNEDNPLLYRLKNPWGTGVNVPILITKDHEEYDADGWAFEGESDYNGIPLPYHYVTIEKTAIDVTAPDYGPLSVGDYTSVRGTDYVYYCRMYNDYTVQVYGYWVGSENIGSGWLEYYPD